MIHKKIKNSPSIHKEEDKKVEEWETVDLKSISNSKCRTVGGESLGHYAFCKLGFPKILKNLGFIGEQIAQTELLLVGRLLHPSSERETLRWSKESSAIGEIIGTDFANLSNNALYRMSDALLAQRNEIEKLLSENEKNLLGLNEKIILYDLTNTYLEGSPNNSEKAKRGRSKEKRSDCPLLTLALVLDEDGFPKCSKVFSGSVSEPDTLKEILDELKKPVNQPELFKNNPTVVIDAGIATKENLKLLRDKGFHYICVSRTRPDYVPVDGFKEIKNKSDDKIYLKKVERNNEILLFCQSPGRAAKEEGIKNRFTQRFEDGLKLIDLSLKNPKGRKSFKSIMERLGRLKEKCSNVARFYAVDVKRDGENAVSIEWKLDKEAEIDAHFNGSYCIRSDRSELSETDLWNLYTMLTQVEDAFRCLKSELGLRPNFHQKDARMEGHLFITVLAYHLIAFIQRQLRRKGIHNRWQTIRNLMSNQARVTTSLTNRDGKRIHIRQTTEAEGFQVEVYRALSLPLIPLRSRKVCM